MTKQPDAPVSSGGSSATSLASGPADIRRERRQWELPRKRRFAVIENQWIGLRDGTRLAARLWIPELEDRKPVPVVLEYIPYRKRDGTRALDNHTGGKLAQHGIAFARVDIRGSGDSEGVLLGEYTQQEHDDALEVIRWLATQSWSNGSVGMRGISWGGFTALQIAAMAPPELKAIMPVCFSDNQFTDDAHYLGGSLCNSNFYWGTMFQTVMTAPPDPDIVGERWRTMWLERLRAAPPILGEWTSHQRFDAHWKAGSVSVDYGRIKCAVYAVGGLTDHFVDVNTRLMANLRVPCKCLIGPWAHNYPDDANPGPGLDWTREEVRWWTQWLLGIETGIMDEPALRIFVCDRTPVEVYPSPVPGRWIAERAWPTPRISPLRFYLNSDGLAAGPGKVRELRYQGNGLVGLGRGEPDAFFFPVDLPQEQSADDQHALTFDSPPLEADCEIVGKPVLHVRVAADATVARVAVRLNEVSPDGKSWMLSSGVLNLTHRDSHEMPSPLEPGRSYDAQVQLFFMAKRVRRGCRLRVAISENFWPLLWPSPRAATLTVSTGASWIELPVRHGPAEEERFPIPPLSVTEGDGHPPTPAGPLSVVDLGPDAQGNISRKKSWTVVPMDVPDVGTRITAGWTRAELSASVRDPSACRWTGCYRFQVDRGSWQVAVSGEFELTASDTTFFLNESIEGREGGALVFERRWSHKIRRDLM
jgi:predicted acyl esterase